MMTGSVPSIGRVSARPVNVPLARPMITGGGSVTAPPLVLEEKLRRRLHLLGAQGAALMALAGIDLAAWDALGRLLERPLVHLLGGTALPVLAYNSNGLALSGPDAVELVEPGFSVVKLCLGYADPKEDLRALRAVRAAVGEGIRVMTDYNQCLSPAEARVRILEVEEPVRFDDYAGCARLREKARLPIQIGENCRGSHDMEKALDAGACDFFMADAVKIGGVTGWLRAQALADGRGVPLSSHLYPEVSAHLLATAPTRHWLEYVDWAAPILADPIGPAADGTVTAPDRPGTGVDWNEAAVERFAA